MARVRLAAPPHRPGYLPFPPTYAVGLFFIGFSHGLGRPMIGHLPASFPATFLPGCDAAQDISHWEPH
jgi:hypothetical protein